MIPHLSLIDIAGTLSFLTGVIILVQGALALARRIDESE